jgi:micrococcal nuclease
VRRIGVVVAGLFLAAGCGAQPASYDGTGDQPSRRPTAPPDAFTATVVRVVDGDTVVARRDGRLLRVRLIGVNAPESVKPDSPVECFGRESARFLQGLLPAGATVRASYEVGGSRDKFGRELWDVWHQDGRFVQGVLVRAGMVDARVYRPQTAYADLLAGLEAEARAAGKGLHRACK